MGKDLTSYIFQYILAYLHHLHNLILYIPIQNYKYYNLLPLRIALSLMFSQIIKKMDMPLLWCPQPRNHGQGRLETQWECWLKVMHSGIRVAKDRPICQRDTKIKHLTFKIKCTNTNADHSPIHMLCKVNACNKCKHIS